MFLDPSFLNSDSNVNNLQANETSGSNPAYHRNPGVRGLQ